MRVRSASLRHSNGASSANPCRPGIGKRLAHEGGSRSPVPFALAIADSAPAEFEAIMAGQRLKFWGWGYEGEGATDAERAAIKRFYGGMFGLGAFPDDMPRIEDYALTKPRLKPPKSLAGICASDPHTRLVHALGKSFPDAVRVFDRKIPHAPD